MSPKIWQSDLGTWGSEIQKHNNIPNTKAYFTSTHQYELWHLSHLSFTVLIPVLVSILQCWCSLFLLPESQTTWFWLLLTSAQYVCWSCSPPAANWALVVNYQFWQPTFPSWLRAKGGLFVNRLRWQCGRLPGTDLTAQYTAWIMPRDHRFWHKLWFSVLACFWSHCLPKTTRDRAYSRKKKKVFKIPEIMLWQ